MGRLSEGTQVGIDLRTGILNAVCTEGDSVVRSVLSVPILDTGSEPSEESLCKNAQKVLQSWVHHEGLKGAPCVFSVPSEQTEFSWSRVNGGDAVPSAAATVSRALIHFPVPGTDTADVLSISAPLAWIAPTARALESIGLNPVGCESDAQAVLRVAEEEVASMSALLRELTMTVVDFGYDRTRFLVLEQEKLQFVRSVRFGSNRFAPAVAEALRLSIPEAVVLLRQPGWRLSDDKTLSWTGTDRVIPVGQQLESLFREIRRLIGYFRTLRRDRSRNGILERLLLSGELLSIEGFAHVLGHELGIRTQTMDPFRNRSFRMPADRFEASRGSGPALTVACGLALSRYTQEVIAA